MTDRSRWFAPILAGATLRDRLIACLGALIGIGLTGLICGAIFGGGRLLPLIVAPMGASAVLLFAVPASPLAQPWPVIGGNTISALVGVAVAQLLPDPLIASGVAVALAIVAMSFTRSLHPPGGAAALTAVVGGAAVSDAGFIFPFLPVALNSIVLVALGIGFHKLSRRTYPHVPQPAAVNIHQTRDEPAQMRVGIRPEDIDAAIAEMGETFDIAPDDLERLLRRVERQILLRSQGDLLCRDIMARDVVMASLDTTPEAARALLLDHNIRTLPVIDDDKRLIGTVGLRELATARDTIRDAISVASTAAPETPAISLAGLLSDGRAHAVIIVDAEKHVLGIVTQTDLVASLARTIVTRQARGQTLTPAL